MSNFFTEAEELFEYTQSLRRDFHMHPELGFHEVRTAGIVAKELGVLNMDVTTGIAKTGVIGILEGAKPGPVVLVRFDMDALPVSEETGASYASTNPGAMHACGHDGHTAIGLTVARILDNHREELAGTAKFVFQPAEEGTCGEEIGGNQMMLREGLLENPTPDLAISLHLWNEKPLGWVHAAGGPVMAGVEHFKVTVAGKGGHAAAPHRTVDPVLAASQIVTALQSIASRNVSPLNPAVVSVTMIHGGTAFNVIPPQVELEGTIRTFEPAVREQVVGRLEQIAKGVGEGMGCQVDVEVKRITPPTINDSEIASRVAAVMKRVLPNAELSTENYLTMGGEDMAFTLEQVPGCYFFIGSANHEEGLDYGHHHPKFDFDEAVLPQAAALMASVVAELLK